MESAPPLDVDFTQDIIEPRITLSVSRLNDILRLLVDRSNTHTAEIAELRGLLTNTQERTATLEKAMDDIKPDGERQNRIESTLDTLASQIEKIRRDYDHRFEAVNKQTKQRNEQFDLSVSSLQDDLLKQTAALRESSSRANTLAGDCKTRLDDLVIPDIGPLESITDRVETWRVEAHDKLKQCLRFMSLWSPNLYELERLCGKHPYGWRKWDKDSSDDGVVTPTTPRTPRYDTTAASVTPRSRSTSRVSPVEGEGTGDGASSEGTPTAGNGTGHEGGGPLSDKERENKALEKVKLALGFPPLASILETIATGERKLTTQLDFKYQTLIQKISEKIDKHEIAELANSMKEQQAEIRQNMDFLDRRLKDSDELVVRMSLAEEKVKYLHYHKAESSALDFKADTSLVQDLRGGMLEVRDDLADIFNKLAHYQQQAAVGGGGGGGLQRGGSFAAIRRTSAGTTPQQVQQQPPHTEKSPSAGSPHREGSTVLSEADLLGGSNGSLSRGASRRLTDLAEMITSLEKRKADKDDLIRLHEYLEVMEKKGGALATGTSGGATAAGATAAMGTAVSAGSTTQGTKTFLPGGGLPSAGSGSGSAAGSPTTLGTHNVIGTQPRSPYQYRPGPPVKSTSTTVQQQQQQRPAGNEGGQQQPLLSPGAAPMAPAVGGEGGADGGTASGGVLPARPPKNTRLQRSADSGTIPAITGGGGEALPGGSPVGYTYRSVGLGGKRTGSAGLRHFGSQDGEGATGFAPEEGVMQGTTLGGPSFVESLGVHPTTTVRQYLGRGVAGVFDSTGACVPVAIGASHVEYRLSPHPSPAAQQ